MNILHVAPAFYPATYWGGPTYSVYGLCNALAAIPDTRLRILTTDTAGPRFHDRVPISGFPMRYPDGYDVYFCKRLLFASVAPRLLYSLWPMVMWADVVHLTGVYSFPTIPTLLVCRILNKPVVWSPRGALQRWKGATRPYLKRVWEWACNALISPKNCILHVTSAEEATDSKVRIAGAPVTLIPNGVEIPEFLPARVWMPGGRFRLLYLGRLHPIKGIENLLQALKALEDEAISLVICGSGDDAYSLGLRNLVDQIGLARSVSFRGHVEGKEKSDAFAQADVCVVPSFSENFGMVVAESLANGVPVVVSKGTPWAGVETHRCGLWVENSPASIAHALRSMKRNNIAEMGGCGRKWMRTEFSWNQVARQTHRLYANRLDNIQL